MIIGISGFGYTGASAYIDVLKEFEIIQSLPLNCEFQIIQQPDGLLDLKSSVVNGGRLNSNAAIRRFLRIIDSNSSFLLSKYSNGSYRKLCEDFVESIICAKWIGKSAYDPDDFRSVFDNRSFRKFNKAVTRIIQKLKPHFTWPKGAERYFSIMTEEEFDNRTKYLISSLISSFGFDLEKPIILEQLFSPTRPLRGREFFNTDVISLVIDRDPRDVYLLTNILYPERSGFMPNSGSVEMFCDYYRLVHTYDLKNSNVFILHFEDLIYKYEETIHLLENILGLKIIKKGSVFKPGRSINNTKLFMNYPQFNDRFAYIEQHLSEYLYQFAHFEEFQLSFDIEEGVKVF